MANIHENSASNKLSSAASSCLLTRRVRRCEYVERVLLFTDSLLLGLAVLGALFEPAADELDALASALEPVTESLVFVCKFVCKAEFEPAA